MLVLYVWGAGKTHNRGPKIKNEILALCYSPIVPEHFPFYFMVLSALEAEILDFFCIWVEQSETEKNRFKV